MKILKRHITNNYHAASIASAIALIAISCTGARHVRAEPVEGNDTASTTATRPPVLVGGTDSSNVVHNIRTDGNGQVYIANPGGGGGGGSTSTVTYPTSHPSNTAGTTSVPLYSTTSGSLITAIYDPTGNYQLAINSSGQLTALAIQSGTWNVNSVIASALPTGTNTIGAVNVNGTVPVSGTFWQTTQPVSGTFWQATQPISVASLPLPSGAALDATLTGGTQTTRISSGGNTATVNTTSPASSDAGLTVRNVPKKTTSILTTTLLGANGVYTSPWVNTNASSDLFIEVTIYADAASAASGVVIQGTDDTSNSNLIKTLATTSASAATFLSVTSTIPTGYWRLVYTNGAAAQSSTFEATATTTSVGLPNVSTAGIAAVTSNASMNLTQIASGAISTSATGIMNVSLAASATNGYTYNHVSANGTFTVKSGAGVLHSITVNNTGTSDTATIYDNTAGSGTVIALINTALTHGTLLFDCAFTTGITVVMTGTGPGDLTLNYK